MRFEGKTTVVTGGMSGIGRATADLFTSEGASVVVVDVDPGADIVLDISEIEHVSAALSKVAADVLVNCAGWDVAQPFLETSTDFWRKSIGINLLGPIAVTHAVLERMPDGGSIVNVASDAGRVGSSGEVVYSGAKGGIIAFGKALAREVAKRGIRVNAVAPGPTDTPFLASFDETGKLADAMKRQTPLRKLATPEDVAKAIAFLASDDAGHITGQVLSVSGGLTMVD